MRMGMAEVVFWTSFLLVVYAYFGYPVLLALWARVRHRTIAKQPWTPAVTVVVAVWNERGIIERRIRNLLASHYPGEKLSVLVGSDGSDDGTADVVGGMDDPRVRVVAFPERRGKVSVLNDLLAEVTTEVVVFADARQEFAPDAINELCANLADPAVGCVSGELVLRPKDGATARGVGLYWKYEKFLRLRESHVGSMLGATGAIYAIKRALFRPIPARVVLDDMFVPLTVIAQGLRAVLEPAAKAFDDVAARPEEEHRRKVRTLFGNYQIFKLFPRLCVPGASPIGFQMLSHKVLRVVAPFFLIACFIASVQLADTGGYGLLLLGQIAFYALALAGHLGQQAGVKGPFTRLTYVPYVFCLLNWSALAGFWRFVTDRQPVTWQKARDG
jgi:cellulose synthase/poly-beta-1,6-N-acetylglucosamine synthase-like glycosyltransferase